jgi:hypothetical protein
MAVPLTRVFQAFGNSDLVVSGANRLLLYGCGVGIEACYLVGIKTFHGAFTNSPNC